MPDKIRYAVVGAGWFTQAAVLPAFQNAKNATLAALVSGDPKKGKELGEQYDVPVHGYDEYDALLAGETIDAVYIVLPNSMHKDYTIRAAKAGVHVLCEKPLAGDAAEAEEMVAACETAGVYLMTAYRLHFESANLDAMETVQSGKIGEPKVFIGANLQMVEEGNTRLDGELKGGPLQDLGIYCINAARYIFRDDPTEVTGFLTQPAGTKFREVPESVTAVMKFPGDKVAMITCGFGHSHLSEYRVVGTAGDLQLHPAYTFQGDITAYLTDESGKTTETSYKERDQVGAEIVYFSECIQSKQPPEPDGREGLADMRVIDAILQSAKTGRAVKLDPFPPKPRPTKKMEYKLPKVSAPELVNAVSPSGD